MDRLYIKPKEIVVPGELIAEGLEYLPSSGTYREYDKIYASKLGIVEIEGRLVKVIPLSGVYIPNKDDRVIGKVIDFGFSDWYIDIGSPYPANLRISEVVTGYIDSMKTDLSKYLDIGDIILAKILNITKSKFIQLTMKGVGLNKLSDGKIIKIIPYKVPRVIGKQGSMINLIKEKTNCEIIVGQNGWVWIRGRSAEDELLATKAIYLIEKESHLSGLTEKIKEMMERRG
jgi:exosome complex component RRP4